MEMKEYLLDPVGREEAIRSEYHPPAAEAEEEVVAVAAVATPASAASGGGGGGAGLASRVPPPPPLASSTAPSSIPSSEEDAATITNNDNLEANEEYANFGLARGTTNTYVIPGMDEMTPEEYRTKLQENISARQVSRKLLGTCCIILPLDMMCALTLFPHHIPLPSSFHSSLLLLLLLLFFANIGKYIE